ncbi:MAG: T9SS type A sorting domain-containing protein [Ignavibacteria bacterium]|nr:T9SS type A sorting domain-containing protein [Ignavibacteria bacterium]
MPVIIQRNFPAGTNLNSGVYFYTLYAGDFVSTKKFILVK